MARALEEIISDLVRCGRSLGHNFFRRGRSHAVDAVSAMTLSTMDAVSSTTLSAMYADLAIISSAMDAASATTSSAVGAASAMTRLPWTQASATTLSAVDAASVTTSFAVKSASVTTWRGRILGHDLVCRGRSLGHNLVLHLLSVRDLTSGARCVHCSGTAGSVSIGAYDDFTALAELAREYNTWLHVDAAFGFWTRLSNDPRIQGLTSGLNRADSIALDAHKWPGVNYSVGALLVKDKEHLRATMMTRPKYLKSATEGLAAGDTWFTDYSLDLSRGFSALKLWAALRTAGRDAIGQVITDHCHLAAHMARLVDASPVLRMAHRPLSNVACFSIDAPGVTAAEVATDLQLGGNGVFSTINLGGVDCLRAAIVNHRCTEADIARCIASVEEAVARKTLEKTIVK